jgi:hypothetical protein
MDFETTSILEQVNGWDCGVAAVTNAFAFAFVWQFEKMDFFSQ